MEQIAVKNALGNPLILQEILKSVETFDLINCRLVTFTNWYELSTNILSRRKDLRISFTHLDQVPNHLPDDKSEGSSSCRDGQDHWKKPGFFTDSTELPLPLNCLTEFVKNPPRLPFPFRRFRFSEGFLEDNDDFAQFIKVYGQHIVELEVDLLARKNVTCVIETLGQTLIQLPNLESLKIGKVSLGWSSLARLFPRKTRDAGFQMPRLTSVRIGPDVNADLNFINDLKAASPNLRVFEKFSLPYSKSEVANYLGYRTKGVYDYLIFCPDERNIEFFEKLLRSRSKFRTISLNLTSIKKMTGSAEYQTQFRARVTSVLTKILNFSLTILKDLQNIEHLELLPDFQIPTLTQVKSLEIRIFNEFLGCQITNPNVETFECFPIKNINFPVTFPCLTSVKLTGPSKDCIRRVNVHNLSTFDPDHIQLNWTPTTTVTSLKIRSESSNFPPALVQHLGQSFLGVEKLDLVFVHNFSEIGPEIWTNFSKLTDFSAILYIDRNCTIPPVEHAFGIDLDLEIDPRPGCSRKVEPEPEPETETPVEVDMRGRFRLEEKLRINPSISDLPELKTVRVEFYPTCARTRKILFSSDCVNQLRFKLKRKLPNAAVTVLSRLTCGR